MFDVNGVKQRFIFADFVQNFFFFYPRGIYYPFAPKEQE